MFQDFIKQLSTTAQAQVQQAANALERQTEKQVADATQKAINDLARQASASITTSVTGLFGAGSATDAATAADSADI